MIHWTDMADVPFLDTNRERRSSLSLSNPNQAALFGGIVFLLGVGGTLSFKRTYLVYLIVPLSFLAITQTGSRSVTWLLIITWVAYVAMLAVVARTNRGWLGRAVMHLLISSIVTAALFVVSADAVGRRSVSLFSVPLVSIATGDADLYRGPLWRATTLTQPAGETRASLKYIHSHNVYLDILVHGGIVILILFLVFMAAVLVLAAILDGRGGAVTRFQSIYRYWQL